MVTSTYYTDKLPDWVERFNARDERNDYASALWHVTMDHNDYVFKKSSAIMLDTTLKFSFENIFRPKNRDYRRLRETPFGNTLLTDFAIEAIDRDSLGADDIPDLMIIDFGAQKYISEYYGVESTELEDAYYKLDRDIARILSHLDTAVGRDNYAVVFTSDHGSISDNVRAEGGRYNSGTFNAIQFRAHQQLPERASGRRGMGERIPQQTGISQQTSDIRTQTVAPPRYRTTWPPSPYSSAAWHRLSPPPR